jgi:hypothetical protein
MATPNLTSGVLERNKPLAVRSNVVWRFEGSLAAGASITTPIFDVVIDGFPLNQVEVGTAAVVRIPSPYLRIVVVMPTSSGNGNPGGVLNVSHISDTGSPQSPFTLYCQPRSGSGANVYGYEVIGRRCQFTLANTPLGLSAALLQQYFFEIVSEG